MIFRIILAGFLALAPSLLSGETVPVPLPGSENVVIEVAETTIGPAPLLRVLADGTERFRIEVAPLCFERRGVGYQGSGSEWNFARAITEVKHSVTEDGTVCLEATACFSEDLPAARPYVIQYRVLVSSSHVMINFISISNPGKVPFRLLRMACPIRIHGEPLQKNLDDGAMVLRFPEGEYRLTPDGKNSSFPSDILLEPPAPLWLETGIVWYDFTDPIRIDFRF